MGGGALGGALYVFCVDDPAALLPYVITDVGVVVEMLIDLRTSSGDSAVPFSLAVVSYTNLLKLCMFLTLSFR